MKTASPFAYGTCGGERTGSTPTKRLGDPRLSVTAVSPKTCVVATAGGLAVAGGRLELVRKPLALPPVVNLVFSDARMTVGEDRGSHQVLEALANRHGRSGKPQQRRQPFGLTAKHRVRADEEVPGRKQRGG